MRASFFLTVFLTGFFGLTLNAHAFAPLSLNELETLSQSFSVSSDFQEPACEQNHSTTKSKVFLFDGDLGFCPLYFKMNRPHLGPGGAGESFNDRLAVTPVTAENEASIQKIKSLLASEDKMRNCLLILTVFEKLKDQIFYDQPDLFYYSKRGEKEAAACAEKTLSEGQAVGVLPEVKVIGYSMGNEAALRFVEMLGQNHHEIETVVSADPVGRGVNWVTGVIYTEDNDIFKVPSNVHHWRNYFQKQDQYSLVHGEKIHFGIRGSRMIDAELNEEILPSDFASEHDREHGHVHILSQPKVLRDFEAVL